LIAFPTSHLALVDINNGETLSRLPIAGMHLDLAYFLDMQEYQLVEMDKNITREINITEDELVYMPEEPIAYFDMKNSSGLCT
jgi:hypothetical protein